MEILKNLSESELNELRRSFLQNLDHGLNEEQFQAVLLKASAGKRLAFPITTPYLVYLFACIDYPGSGYVTWDDFSLFLIEQERASHVQMLLPPDTSPTGTNSSLSSPLMDPSIQQEEIKQRRRRRRKKLHAMAHPSEESSVGASSSGEDNEEDDGFTVFREYNLERAVPTAFETQVSFLYYAYRWNKLIKIVNDAKGLSTITIHHPNKVELPLYASLPRQPETALTVEYIPPTVGVRHAHSIACAYNGGIIRLFTAEKRHSIDEFLNLTKTINVPETQTVLKWAPSFCRLTMGSRGGIVSVWNVDEDQLYAQEKLHNGPITSIQLHRGMMYTASMDPNNSVKVVDLERSVVRFSFHDHTVGGALDMVVDEECLYSIGFEGKVVQRFLQYPKSQPSFLYDPVQPHEGRLCCMRRVPNTPLLLTSDSRGTLKIWDLRMGSCVQTMKFTSSTAAARANANRQQVNPFSTFIAHKSNKLPTNKNSNFVSPVVTESSPVNTACPLLNTGLILIGTSRELVTLSSAETTFPDLADDERSCRFIMMPNPHRFITIHEREAKLWQAETGHLIYSVEDLTQADVSSCSLVEPLRRQFVVGSMDGELRSFSVALGRGTFDFSPALEEAGFGGLELLSLHSLPRFRDYAAPYLIMTYPTGVCFLPMVEGVPATAVMRLHALTPLLDDKPCVTGSRLERDHLFVSTSTPAIHVFDLHHLGVPIATYQLTTNAENMCCAPLLSRLARSKVRLVSTPPPEEVYPASCALGEAAVSESPPEEDPAHGDDPRHLPDLLLQKRSPPLTTAFSTPKMATATATAITTTPRSMAQTVVFSVVLAADSSGSIVVGHALTNPMRENTMATLERAYHLVGDFNAGNSATWRWYHRRKHLRSLAKVPGQAAIPTTTFLNTSQRHIGGGPPNNTTATAGGGGAAANAGTATSPSALPAVLKQTPSSGSVARAARSKLANNNNNSSTPPLPALTPSATPAVTHVCYFDSFDVLATGDEHGQIRLWDMNGVVEVCRSTTEHVDPRQPTAAKHRGGQAGRGKPAKPSTIVEGGYAPVLITDWLSHPKGLTAMFGILHPSSHLPIIITAGVENTVLLWSADGVELGSLATGRLADDATGGRRFGLRPYALFESSFEHLHASWGVFMSYMSSHMSKDGEMELKTMQPVEESASALLRVTSPDLGRSAEEALARSHNNISPSALVPSFFVTETQAAAKNSVSNLDCRSTGLFGDSLSMMGSSICSEFEVEEEDTRSNEKLGIIKSIYQGKLNPTRRRPKPHLSRLHPTGTHPQQLPAIQHTAGEELGQDEQTEEDDLSQQRAEKFVSRAKEIREDRKRGKHRKALVKGGGIDNSANKWLGVGNTRGPPLITNGTNARVLTKQKKMTPRVVLPSLFPSAST